MALPASTAAPSPSPQVVGISFVEQYYHILHQSPESVYKFYQESSILTRPNSDGVMTLVTTTSAINDMVLSLGYKDYISEIISIDTQPTYNEGVFILVTGWLTGQNKVRRKFTQAFYLAPQGKGVYFVLNDMFRFVDETEPKEINQIIVNDSCEDAPKDLLNPDSDLSAVQDHDLVDSASSPSEGFSENDEGICNPTENGDAVVEQEVTVVEPPVQESVQNPVSEVTSSVVQDDTPKKSYASIVKVIKGSTSPGPIYVSTTKKRPAVVNPEKLLTVSDRASAPSATTSAPETSATGSNSASERSSSNDAEGYSIFVRNLPMDATPEQVEAEFKKFGPIKPGGVQVRSRWEENFCFGFVEFESMKSMQAALQVSSILIGDRQAFIAEKRTDTRVVNGVVTNGSNGGGRRGRYLPGRGGFRNDNFRGRGGFGGNQSFRSDFRGQGEHIGWDRGQGYQQRILNNGYGRSGRPAAARQTTVSA